MGMKLHRNRRVFRQRHPLPRILAWTVGALAVVALGFFGAKYFTENPIQTDGDAVISQTEVSKPESVPADTPVSTPEKPTPTPTADGRGFYLPLSAVRNADSLKATLQQAADAGFSRVVFDLKDADGALYYRSETARAAQVNSFTADALSLSDLEALFTTIRDAGLTPTPRLFAFMDNAAARALPTARVMHQSDPNWVWYDANPSKGGRAWLNPYADEAQLYIIELAKELRDAGAGGILLDGVQFPAQTSSASFGNVTLSHDEALTAFIAKARTMLGSGCPVTLSCTAAGALGSDTRIYGANPLTFTPNAVAPMLLTGSMPARITAGSETVDNTPDNQQATLRALVNQMTLRIKVMAADEQPALTPWIQAYDYSAAQIKSAIDGCIAGGANNFILYNPTGQYDFAALK